jgi:hypothetical protein
VSIDPLSDDKIIDSWHRNVSPWTAAVREQRIESRKLVTNGPILDAVLRPGSWTGFSADFVDPAPWYFRTMETWIALIAGGGLRLCEVREPLHPATQKPASVIFIAAQSRPQ